MVYFRRLVVTSIGAATVLGSSLLFCGDNANQSAQSTTPLQTTSNPNKNPKGVTITIDESVSKEHADRVLTEAVLGLPQLPANKKKSDKELMADWLNAED